MGKQTEGTTQERAEGAPPATGGKRFTVTFSDEVYGTLTEMAEASGKSMAVVLRDAIILEKWIQDARKQGYRILLEKDSKVREIMLR